MCVNAVIYPTSQSQTCDQAGSLDLDVFRLGPCSPGPRPHPTICLVVPLLVIYNGMMRKNRHTWQYLGRICSWHLAPFRNLENQTISTSKPSCDLSQSSEYELMMSIHGTRLDSILGVSVFLSVSPNSTIPKWVGYLCEAECFKYEKTSAESMPHGWKTLEPPVGCLDH